MTRKRIDRINAVADILDDELKTATGQKREGLESTQVWLKEQRRVAELLDGPDIIGSNFSLKRRDVR